MGSCDKDHLGLGAGNNTGASLYAGGAAASLHGLYSAAAANSKSSIQSFYNTPRDSLHSLYNPHPPAMSKHHATLSSGATASVSGAGHSEVASICSTLLPRANAGNSVGSRGLTTSSASSMGMLYSSLPVVSTSASDLYSTSLGISTSGGTSNPLAGAFRNQFLTSDSGSNPGSPVGLSHSHHPQHTSHSSTTSASSFPVPPAGCSPPPNHAAAGNLFSSLPHPLATPTSTSKEGGGLLSPPHLSMQHPNLPCSLSSSLPFNFRQHYSYLQSSYSSSTNH